MLKSGFQGAIFLFSFLFRKPVCPGDDGLGNVVVGQAGFADDGEADGRDPAQIAERRRDGAHGAARAGGGGIAAHELVGEDHAGRAVGDGTCSYTIKHKTLYGIWTAEAREIEVCEDQYVIYYETW